MIGAMFSSISYLRRYRDPHGALGMLGPACRRVGTVQLVRVPMHPVLAGGATPPGRLSVLLGKLFGHLRLIPRAYAPQPPGARALFVREFLTTPLFMVAPFIWLQRRRLWFMCHHNVGQAAQRPSHRFMLRALYGAGFRFVVYETPETWAPIAAQPDPARVIAMPTPIPEISRHTPLRLDPERRIVVGFIGSFRAERSPLWALEAIEQALAAGELAPNVDLLVGTADPQFLERWKDRAQVIDTTTRADYLAALEACDVVVLPYDEPSYSYRTSGVLAESAALGCMVVAPDLPALRDQVGLPMPIGVCYKNRAELVDSVRRAVELAARPSRADATQAHREQRSGAAVDRAIARMGAS
jgi:glycosyltransferase involved in cell wall biosynthesis